VEALRINQAVVRGLAPDDPALDGCVREVLRVAGRGYVDLYWAIPRGRQALLQICYMAPGFQEAMRLGLDSRRGLIIVGAHMSSFDILLLSFASLGFDALGLAYPEVQGSYPVLNQLRRDHGLDVMPISVPALRTALRRLHDGGLVLTGVDRPTAAGDLLTFFGRPARMPTGHARLAVRTGAYILPAVCQKDDRGRYRVVGGELIDPRPFGTGPDAPQAVAQSVITVLEGFIRQRPEEWLMFFPVWPDRP
jgi:KDO2-lipid IV(A) lauroyltransferase